MPKSKRVLFTFDPRNYNNLLEVTNNGGFQSAADAVRDALQVIRSLQQQAAQGFTEVVTRNPQTGQERVIVLPSFGLGVPDTRGVTDCEPVKLDQTAETKEM
jgi:hypothetical protein